jgi:hypothetical protein
MLTHDDIEEYREIYKKEFGKEIPYEKAKRQANKLVRLFQVVYEKRKLLIEVGKEVMKSGKTNK